MAAVKKAKKDLKNAKAEFTANKSVTSKSNVEKKKKALERMEEQLTKLQVNLTDKVSSLLNVKGLLTQGLKWELYREWDNIVGQQKKWKFSHCNLNCTCSA